MNINWFSRKGLLFTPIHPIGWIVVLLASVNVVISFLDIDSRSHSVSDTLMNFAFRLVLIYLVYAAVAYFFSKPSSRN